MKKSFNLLLVFLFLLCSCVSVYQVPKENLTVIESLDMAIKSNAQIRIKWTDNSYESFSKVEKNSQGMYIGTTHWEGLVQMIDPLMVIDVGFQDKDATKIANEQAVLYVLGGVLIVIFGIYLANPFSL